jgi:excisionase family DNA binding protein
MSEAGDITEDCVLKPRTVSVEQAGQILGISRIAAYRGIESGDIPHIKIGKRIRVPLAKGWDSDLRSPDYLPPPGSDWPPGREQSGRLKLVYDRDRG